MKKTFFALALIASQQAAAEPAHLNYENLIDCVELSLTLDDMLKKLQTEEGLDGMNVAARPQNEDGTRAEFNRTAVRFNTQCSRTTYNKDELAMICTNEPYDGSMFCKTMAW